MTIDERIEALTMNLQLLTRDVHDTQRYIRELTDISLRTLEIVQSHEHRITRLEGQGE